MINSFKLGLRNGMTVAQYGDELKKRRVRAMLAHARWSGRHLAKFILLSQDFNLINSKAKLNELVWSKSLLAHPYSVHPLLVNYAMKVAREKIYGGAKQSVR